MRAASPASPPPDTARPGAWCAARRWCDLALHPATVRRASLTAAFVGVVLVAINHGDAVLKGRIDAGRALRILLTAAVPYVVSTVSSVSTRLELARARGRGPEAP